jgi:predicted DsbA family dithiol-disulfide isomerase
LKRAERVKRDYPVQIEWRAYKLRPGTPTGGIPRVPKPGAVNGFPPNLIEYAEGVGLKLVRSPVIPCSLPALEVAEYAKGQGKFDQFHQAVFKAYWEEAKNIGLRDILLQIAQESGLDTAEVTSCLDEGRYTTLIKKQSEEAKQSGINGIPAFVIGSYFIEGAQPYSVFQGVFEDARRKAED